MIRKSKGATEWLEFEQLSDIAHLSHAVFLRHGGYSNPPFGLNMGGNTGDDSENIARNRAHIAELFGIPKIISSFQKHGTNILTVPTADPLLEQNCDGICTQASGIGLLIKHADCQAALFYDPIKRAIANVHCGWRGNVQNIYGKTVDYMQKTFGSRPENLLVCISPSLGPEASEFKNYLEELPQHFYSYQVKPTYFNLWAISQMQLEEAGILPAHIELANICTYTNGEDFFSYRREKITGRHGTIICLR